MSKSKKHEIIEFIKHFLDHEGKFPTLNEIKNGVGLKSVSTVHQHIKDLVESGVLIDDNMGGYELADSKYNNNKVAVVGYIAAGFPIETIEDINTTITVPGLPANRDFYALQVKGNSMIDEGIFDGDTVVIKHQTSAQNGQTVVAIIDDNKATLKKLYKENGKFRLQSANQAILPLIRDEVEIRGIVWSIHRSMNNDMADDAPVIPTKNWRTVDLFAGVGGIRLGFEKSGFSTVFANDFEAKCADTYNQNFDTSKLVIKDITKIHTKDIPDCDFVLGGFPCQAFSIAGYRKGFEDEKGRGNLFFDIARIIKDKQPTGFLLENGKALMSQHNADFGQWILRDILRLNEGELLTYDMLAKIGIDSVEISKKNSRYYIDFKQLGSYEQFIGNIGSDDQE